jgi:hypothetical protein
VVSPDTVCRFLAVVSYESRMILTTACSAGLRVYEVVNPHVNDVDPELMVIHVRQAKLNKN